MYLLFDLIDSAEQEKTIQEKPKETIYQEHSKTTFHPELAQWKENEYMPGLMECKVSGYIPENLFSPLDRRNCQQFSKEWHVQQEQWTSYVWSISKAYPKESTQTYWEKACDKFNTARIERTPIQLVISKSCCEQFVDFEVIEYLSSSEGSVSND